MIKIKYSKINNLIKGIEVSGHANYDEEGKDIVCSAVSACVVGGLNALKSVNKYLVDIKKGNIKFDILDYVDDYDQIVLETIITQLYTIAENYPKYVKIEK